MKLILEYQSGAKVYYDYVWSLATMGPEKTVIRNYKYKPECFGEEVRSVVHFDDKIIEWNFCYDTSIIYGFFSRYLGFTKKARGVTAKRADENVCFKLLCTEEMDEVENTGIKHTDWMTFEEYYSDLPF